MRLTDYWFYAAGRWVFDLVLSDPDAVKLCKLSSQQYAAAIGARIDKYACLAAPACPAARPVHSAVDRWSLRGLAVQMVMTLTAREAMVARARLPAARQPGRRQQGRRGSPRRVDERPDEPGAGPLAWKCEASDDTGQDEPLGVQFYRQFRNALTRTPARENYLMQLILLGSVGSDECVPAYLSASGYETGR